MLIRESHEWCKGLRRTLAFLAWHAHKASTSAKCHHVLSASHTHRQQCVCYSLSSTRMTTASHSLFLILKLFNWFISVDAEPLSLFVTHHLSHIRRGRTISLLSMSSPVLALESVMPGCTLWAAAKTLPVDHYSTLGELNEPAEREGSEERERETELRDGVKPENVKRRWMLNKQHRDEVLKRCRGGLKDHTALNLTCVGGSLPSSPRLLLQFQRWIPSSRPEPEPGISLWLLHKQELAIWAGKMCGLTWGKRDEGIQTG